MVCGLSISQWRHMELMAPWEDISFVETNSKTNSNKRWDNSGEKENETFGTLPGISWVVCCDEAGLLLSRFILRGNIIKKWLWYATYRIYLFLWISPAAVPYEEPLCPLQCSFELSFSCRNIRKFACNMNRFILPQTFVCSLIYSTTYSSTSLAAFCSCSFCCCCLKSEFHVIPMSSFTNQCHYDYLSWIQLVYIGGRVAIKRAGKLNMQTDFYSNSVVLSYSKRRCGRLGIFYWTDRQTASQSFRHCEFQMLRYVPLLRFRNNSRPILLSSSRQCPTNEVPQNGTAIR